MGAVGAGQSACCRALHHQIPFVTEATGANRTMRARAYAVTALAISCLIAAIGSPLAQPGPADPQRGHELAARLCANCHVIDGQRQSKMAIDVPSFPIIANREGVTAEHLAGRIIVPHPAMPGVSLTASEIRDIVAYIISTKRKD